MRPLILSLLAASTLLIASTSIGYAQYGGGGPPVANRAGTGIDRTGVRTPRASAPNRRALSRRAGGIDQTEGRGRTNRHRRVNY